MCFFVHIPLNGLFFKSILYILKIHGLTNVVYLFTYQCIAIEGRLMLSGKLLVPVESVTRVQRPALDIHETLHMHSDADSTKERPLVSFHFYNLQFFIFNSICSVRFSFLFLRFLMYISFRSKREWKFSWCIVILSSRTKQRLFLLLLLLINDNYYFCSY